MINYFRMVSLVEGISYLLILSVTFGYISRDFVSILGMSHGILFLLYFMFSLIVSHKQTWPVTTWLLILVAAFIPFAFIPVEMFLKKEAHKAAGLPQNY